MDSPGLCPVRWLSDQNFPMYIPQHDFYNTFYGPWKWYNQGFYKEVGSTLENEKENYKITLDVQHFRSDELNVKVSNNEIIVEGKHEERPDTHGFITRQFKRRYPLPSHCPSDNVTSTLSSDGILTIIAEKRTSTETEKIVPIKICGAIPRKPQSETKICSEMAQINIQNDKANESVSVSSDKSQMNLKEEHSRLLKPELLKEINLETNGSSSLKAATKKTVDLIKTTEYSEPTNISSTSSKIEESIGKSILGLTALTEQLGHSNLISTAGTSSMKTASEFAGIKSAKENNDMKVLSDKCDIQSMLKTSEMKDKSESSMKALSKTLIEESSSSYKSSSSMSSSTRVSQNTSENICDTILAELREAAENV